MKPDTKSIADDVRVVEAGQPICAHDDTYVTCNKVIIPYGNTQEVDLVYHNILDETSQMLATIGTKRPVGISLGNDQQKLIELTLLEGIKSSDSEQFFFHYQEL